MAGLLRGSRRWLGLTRAFQGVGVTCTDCALETGLRLQTGASFATLPNKARQSKAQAKKSDPDAAESQPDQPRTRAASAFKSSECLQHVCQRELRERESSKPHNTAQTNFAEDGSRMEDSWHIRKAEVQGTG